MADKLTIELNPIDQAVLNSLREEYKAFVQECTDMGIEAHMPTDASIVGIALKHLLKEMGVKT